MFRLTKVQTQLADTLHRMPPMDGNNVPALHAVTAMLFGAHHLL